MDMVIRRNLAFYKNAGTPWTADEYNEIIAYCEDGEQPIHKDDIDSTDSKYKYIFDSVSMNDPESDTFMDLSKSSGNAAFKQCTKVAYESIFGTIKFKKYNIQEYTNGTK